MLTGADADGRRRSHVRRTPRPARSSTRAIVRGAVVDSFRKLDPRHPGPQPGHVRRRGRQRPHDRALRPGARRPRRGAGRLHPRASRSGCGSPCSSPTSPRRWPRAAARRRPTRCARRARTSRPSSSPSRGATRRRARSPASQLRKGDLVLVEAGDVIPGDGEIVEGIASVDESAITGESAPVIRESGGDRSAVTGGTRVLSDWLVVRITRQPRRDLPRPHDRAGRGRQAPEDAERDRAQHPARRR